MNILINIYYNTKKKLHKKCTSNIIAFFCQIHVVNVLFNCSTLFFTVVKKMKNLCNLNREYQYEIVYWRNLIDATREREREKNRIEDFFFLCVSIFINERTLDEMFGFDFKIDLNCF